MSRGAAMKDREAGFALDFHTSKLPEYNALFDGNLRKHFESRTKQSLLHSVGLIDRDGHVVDLSRNMGKLSIIEQEFRSAEKAESQRLREEDEMRKRVQKKRHEALDRQRHLDKIEKLKEERKLRAELTKIARGEVGASSPLKASASASLRSSFSPTDSGFK